MSRIDIGEIQAFLYQLRAANESGRTTIQNNSEIVCGDNIKKEGSLCIEKIFPNASFFF
ncbi:hypothetical protein G6K79_001950 [Listeria monocytogenes]|nr:hypothetical protein [Listeria monocytogenes]EHC5246861.1 hypothetical protein [Listeria monocytogenes serotype 1/2a]EEO6478890.1 hypothetical protein [Listeria monocytogenes]EHC6260582.1 hypothetical protein [Listeria monocytogenes serotype 1/2a]EHD1709728.1 hypothetical protein [Listeria monocytogenes]